MIKTKFILALAFFIVQTPLSAQEADNILYIEQAVKFAQNNDPWLVGNKHAEDSTKSLSVAAGSLPDPTVSLSFLNLPTDSFSFNQENMTQIKMGVAQTFPQGNSLNIKRQQLELKASEFPYQRQDRRAKVAVTVSQLWLDVYKAQESIALIETNRSLFEQLTEIAMSSYSSAMGKTRQQDIIRAQLELTRLNDRVTILNQQQDMFTKQLAEWVNDYFTDQYSVGSNTESTGMVVSVQGSNFKITNKLPDTLLLYPQFYNENIKTDPEILFKYFSNHPSMKEIEQKIRVSRAGVDLAKQKYKPAWGLNASYSNRSKDLFGSGRADFLTVGVSLSVPLFTKNRQDREYQSAISQREAIRIEKWQLLRKMIAEFETVRAQLLRLNERQELFQTDLLPQMSEQAEASLTAYTNDDGDFAEVVRARIAELNAQIDVLNINVERQKTIVQLNYYFTASENITPSDDMFIGEIR